MQMKELNKEQVENILLGVGCNNFNRWETFCSLCRDYELTDEAYNYGLNLAYTCGYAGKDAFFYFFDPRVSMKLLMDEKEVNEYELLPNDLTVLRGCNSKEAETNDFGISWTTERRVAEFFAFRFENHDGRVYGMDIDKRDILAFFNGRNEFEVIVNPYNLCFSDCWSVPYIVTDKPTELYVEYACDRPYLSEKSKDEIKQMIKDW